MLFVFLLPLMLVNKDYHIIEFLNKGFINLAFAPKHLTTRTPTGGSCCSPVAFQVAQLTGKHFARNYADKLAFQTADASHADM